MHIETVVDRVHSWVPDNLSTFRDCLCAPRDTPSANCRSLSCALLRGSPIALEKVSYFVTSMFELFPMESTSRYFVLSNKVLRAIYCVCHRYRNT